MDQDEKILESIKLEYYINELRPNKRVFIAFDGVLWPGRLLGFATGIFSFAACTNIFMGEGLTNKTIISLILSLVLVLIQVFWK